VLHSLKVRIGIPIVQDEFVEIPIGCGVRTFNAKNALLVLDHIMRATATVHGDGRGERFPLNIDCSVLAARATFCMFYR
jgi:hypothetical protein